jgi:hypothetical protein
LRRVIKPEDVAGATLYLASAAAERFWSWTKEPRLFL